MQVRCSRIPKSPEDWRQLAEVAQQKQHEKDDQRDRTEILQLRKLALAMCEPMILIVAITHPRVIGWQMSAFHPKQTLQLSNSLVQWSRCHLCRRNVRGRSSVLIELALCDDWQSALGEHPDQITLAHLSADAPNASAVLYLSARHVGNGRSRNGELPVMLRRRINSSATCGGRFGYEPQVSLVRGHWRRGNRHCDLRRRDDQVVILKFAAGGGWTSGLSETLNLTL